MTVTAHVRLTAKPGRRAELLEIMAGSIVATRVQPLCSSVEVMKGVEGADDILLVEEWPSIDDHMQFINGVIEAGGLAPILDILAGEIETLHYTKIPS